MPAMTAKSSQSPRSMPVLCVSLVEILFQNLRGSDDGSIDGLKLGLRDSLTLGLSEGKSEGSTDGLELGLNKSEGSTLGLSIKAGPPTMENARIAVKPEQLL